MGTAANRVDCIDQIRAARGRDIPAMIITGVMSDSLQSNSKGAMFCCWQSR
ncbi:Unknown protein sequence [Pseudomonas syringae pv. cilantro]|uniref:Uncharacterized protein n=1 Tax=Pseudomonas syringae pv. cilantro TaxID=81035 RepID=A0A0N0GH40_PSESX|nr:Unknown protein sequence [Pseudomonas syringae pv. cilantro]